MALQRGCGNLMANGTLVLKRTDKAHDLRLAFHRALPTAVLYPRRASFMGQSNLLPSGTGLNSGWKELYAAAVLELDDTKLPDRIAKARAAMRDRADLPTSSGEECRTLSDGFHILRVIEKMAMKRNPAA
jgi:hypothetical protein